MRDFLFYISCNKGKCDAELFGINRIYDVAINDYTGSNTNPEEAEYKFSEDEWKYRHIYLKLSDIVFNYKAIGIFDDDIKISTNDLNNLFTIGDTANYNIWQAALTRESPLPWPHLYQKGDGQARETNTMEIMMPVFSNQALKICWDSFIINYSAWGLDIAWAYLLKNKGIMVIDSISATHTRPLTTGRIMPNKLTPDRDAELVLSHYGIKKPTRIY